jgi:hypothetical protein
MAATKPKKFGCTPFEQYVEQRWPSLLTHWNVGDKILLNRKHRQILENAARAITRDDLKDSWLRVDHEPFVQRAAKAHERYTQELKDYTSTQANKVQTPRKCNPVDKSDYLRRKVIEVSTKKPVRPLHFKSKWIQEFMRNNHLSAVHRYSAVEAFDSLTIDEYIALKETYEAEMQAYNASLATWQVSDKYKAYLRALKPQKYIEKYHPKPRMIYPRGPIQCFVEECLKSEKYASVTLGHGRLASADISDQIKYFKPMFKALSDAERDVYTIRYNQDAAAYQTALTARESNQDLIEVNAHRLQSKVTKEYSQLQKSNHQLEVLNKQAQQDQTLVLPDLFENVIEVSSDDGRGEPNAKREKY